MDDIEIRMFWQDAKEQHREGMYFFYMQDTAPFAEQLAALRQETIRAQSQLGHCLYN